MARQSGQLELHDLIACSLALLMRFLGGAYLQVASFGIVINQMWSLMDEIFTSECDYCRGTGRIICRHCHGTKTLRKRPGEFHYQHMAVVDRSPRDL